MARKTIADLEKTINTQQRQINKLFAQLERPKIRMFEMDYSEIEKRVHAWADQFTSKEFDRLTHKDQFLTGRLEKQSMKIHDHSKTLTHLHSVVHNSHESKFTELYVRIAQVLNRLESLETANPMGAIPAPEPPAFSKTPLNSDEAWNHCEYWDKDHDKYIRRRVQNLVRQLSNKLGRTQRSIELRLEKLHHDEQLWED